MTTMTTPMTEEDIKDDVEEQLYWDDRVNASDVGVTVDDGIVALRGTVPTHFARNAAVSDAMSIAGVTDVTDNLTVSYPSSTTTPTSTELVADVEAVLRINPDIDASDIDVEVTGGQVTLDGAVDAFWKKLRAEALASNVSGAVSIDNQLNVIRAKDFIDQDIGEAITEALERNALVEAQDVDVIVEDGVVTLAGTVPTRTARQAAYNAARYTLGVVDVHNNLLVE